MQNTEIYPRFRFVMGTLNILCSNLTHIINMLAAPLLVFLAADFGLDNATAGYASTVHILFQGIFMFIGPMIIGAIDNKKTQTIGLSIMVLGSVVSYLAPDFGVLIAARMLTGMGHGISASCINSVVAAWFPPRERSIVITINGIGIAAVTTFTYTCAVPMYYAFGNSWKMVLLVLGLVVLALDIIWIIFARDNHALNARIKARNTAEGKKTNAFSGMKEALSRKDVWMLWLFMGLFSIGANGISTYLPQFLQNVRGYAPESASSIVGVATGVSIAATLLGGITTTALGKRKPIILPLMIAITGFLTLSLISAKPFMISGLFILYTFASNFRTVASETIATELPGSTPALVSSVASMSFGIGFIGTLICSPMLAFSTKLLGETYSMLIFVPLFILSFIFALRLPETGPGKARK